MSSIERLRSAPPTVRADVAGVVLLVAAVLWSFAAAAISGGSAIPVAALAAGSAGAVVLGRSSVRFAPWLAPALVVAVASVLLLLPQSLSPAPLQGPFGYANAAGAFFALAAVGGLLLAVRTSTPWVRALGAIAAVAFASVPMIRGSIAPTALLLLAPIALVWSRGAGRVRAAVLAGAGLFLAALLATIVIGAAGSVGDRPSGIQGRIESALSARRVTLWHDALAITAEHPIAGVGPGRFGDVSQVARRDRDARWAHNEFLQQGAEQGIPGVLLLVALVLWGFARLWFSPTPDAATVLGASALTLLAVHACVDYVAHFPSIPIAAAVLVGAAQASATGRTRYGAEVDEPDLVGA